MPGTSLDLQSQIDKIFYFGIVVDGFFEFRNLLERLRNANVATTHRRWDQLGDLLHIAIGHAKRSANVLYRGTRGHCSECNDLADGFSAVDLGNMFDYF